MALIGRVLVSLAAVLGVMWVVARRMRAGSKKGPTRLIEVLGRQQVSRGASVAVVRVGEQALVVGVTDNQVSVLAETDLAAAQSMLAQNDAPARKPARSKHASPSVRFDKGVDRRVVRAVEETAPARPGALSGSALSPATWKQTIESLRDLTTRGD